MEFPIWVSAVELECCQPDATVGEPWVASVVALRPAEPWWVRHWPGLEVPQEVLTMGVVELTGRAASTALHTRAAIVDLGGVRAIVPGADPAGEIAVHGRLWLDAHEHPEHQGTPGLPWHGIVRRVRGIPLAFRPITVYRAIPYRQNPAVDLYSTSDRRDSRMADRGFAEFLINLEV